MDKKMVKKFEELDEDLRSLFESIKDYSDNQLNRSKDGKWSILQNMHHLILSEGFAHQYLEKKLSYNPTLKNSGISNAFRFRMLAIFMKTGIKRDAPQPVNTSDLPNDTKFWETVKKWKDQRKALKDYLQNMESDLHKKQLFKHPFSGKMTTFQMLKFFQMHFNRHHQAIKLIAKELPKQID